MTRFSNAQTTNLEDPLQAENVKQRQGGGRTFSYVEGYHVINEANRIFGFGEWSTEVTQLDCVVNPQMGEPNYKGQSNQGYLVAYIAKVKVTVQFDDGTQSHEDTGYGEGIDYNNVGQAHESATKEAVTDAEKRALRHWGNQFGLALYDKEQREVEGATPAARQPAKPRSTQAQPTKARDPATIKNLGDLYNACKEDFQLLKVGVLNALEIRDETLISDPADAYQKVKAVHEAAR